MPADQRRPPGAVAAMALWVVVTCAGTSAFAADAGADFRRHQDETWRTIRPRPDAQPLPEAVPPRRSDAAAAASDASVEVEGFEVHGVTLLSADEVQDALAPYAGRSLDTRGLHEAALALQQRYRARGLFLAKVLIPPQTLTGVVRLDVLEGRFDDPAVEVVQQGTRTRVDAVRDILTHYLVAGQPVHAEAVERSLLLAEDLPGVRISSVMYPGRLVGTARLRTVMSDEPAVSGNVDIDNFGSRDTGQTRLGSTLYVNSPTGVGDQIIARLVTSGSGSQYGYVQYLRPVSASGWRLGASVDDLRYRSRFYQGVGDARGNAADVRLLAHYPVVRSRFFNVNLRAELGQIRLHDRNDLGLNARRRLDVASLALYGDRAHDGWPGGITYFDANLTTGRLRVRGDESYRRYDDAGPQARGSFSTLGLTLQRLQRIQGPWSAHVRWEGQLATGNLDSTQKFHLGGGTSMAGYPVGQASGDQGWALHAELRRDLPNLWGGNLHALAFAEYGQVRQHHSPWDQWQGGDPSRQNTQSLKTVGLGLVHTLESRWLFRALVGWQVGRNGLADPLTGADVDGRVRDWRAWFQVVRYF